jgi:hypothetical protein
MSTRWHWRTRRGDGNILDVEGLPYITLLVNGINHPDDRGA